MSEAFSEKHAATSPKTLLLDFRGHIIPQQDAHYIEHTFMVPPNVSKVGVILRFMKQEDKVQLYVSLHDPYGFRGHQQCPEASTGALPGELPKGKWRAQIDFDRLFEEADYHLITYVEFESVPKPVCFDYPENHIVKREAGWYRGELHAHSNESDAKYPVETVVKAAIDMGLDFLSLTDHFTVSHWRKLASLIDLPIALIRSCEITAHFGHANLHGIKQWIDVYVDRADWTMNHAADAVHKQGGVFCVNHPFSGYMAWRYLDFDWQQADLMEIYQNLEGCNNDLQLPLWDRLLSSGYRIVGVGGTDSHDPFQGNEKLGSLVTWVYANELSEQGIIAGLRRGNVYVSKGVQLRFTASCETGENAGMWQSISRYDLPGIFHVEVLSDEPLRLFVIKNGFLLNHNIVFPGNTGEWQSSSFIDTPKQPSFYRLELHKNTERSGNVDYPGIYWRDYSTMRALSNPIWVGKSDLSGVSKLDLTWQRSCHRKLPRSAEADSKTLVLHS
jgi:hypothetical protein